MNRRSLLKTAGLLPFAVAPAICGNWWTNDTYHQTKAGYALFDLYDDGSIDRTYLPYS